MIKLIFNAIFLKLDLLLIIVLALNFQIFFVESAYNCPKELSNINCVCKFSINKLVKVECFLQKNTTIHSAFNIFNTFTTKIDKISILKCEKKNELLEQLPNLQVIKQYLILKLLLKNLSDYFFAILKFYILNFLILIFFKLMFYK